MGMGADRRVLSLVLIGLVLIGLASLVAWFLTHFERRTLEVPAMESFQVRRNPLFAAELLLDRLEISVESVPGRAPLRDPPALTDTLVVRGLGTQSDAGRAALMAWVAAGGNLVVEAMDPWLDDGHSDGLLETNGVRLRVLEPGMVTIENEARAMVGVPRGGTAEPLSVSFREDRFLESESAGDWELYAEGRLRLVKLPVGKGALTVLSDVRFMTNGWIGENDHALFTAWLTQPDPGGKVWLLYDTQVPGLWEILWGSVPQALLSGALTILVWVWSIGARLGPLEPPPKRRRRDLREHLEAAGRFGWRHGRAAHLVEATRKRVRAAWERQGIEIGQEDPQARIAQIAAAARQSAEMVHGALHDQANEARAFITQAQRLQLLWQVARPAREPGVSPLATTTASHAIHRRMEGDG